MAPKSAAAEIGAPNPQNTVNHNLNVQNFTGEIRKIPLRDYFENSQNDGRRKDWLPQFLAQDGMQLLIELLKNLSALNMKNKDEQTSRIAKKCLSEVMECVRILLICLFCSEFSEAGMTLDLRRKISFDPSQEVKKEQAKTTNKLQQVQENTMEEMKPLIEMMSLHKSDMSQRLVDGLESF